MTDSKITDYSPAKFTILASLPKASLRPILRLTPPLLLFKMASRSGGSSRNSDPFAIPAAGIRVERSATIIIARRRKCIDGELACTTVTAEQLGADRQHGRNTAAQNLLGDERKLGFESNWELCMAQNEVRSGLLFFLSSFFLL